MARFCPRCGHQGDDGACPRDGTELVPVGTHDLIGHPLGDYTVLASLGGGSFGRVYRAIHARSGGVVAIKLIQQPISWAADAATVGDAPAATRSLPDATEPARGPPRAFAESTDVHRVVREARAAAMIRHPNVVAVYDLGLTSDRRPYIVMQHLDGTSLRRHLSPRAALVDLLPLASDVLRGLAAAHRLGVVHRDLKPDNVFVVAKPHPHAVIVDFGLAKLVADPNAPHLTITGESIGTPRYMAPEQIRGKPVDGRADLYAVGVMMYEVLAGEPPFHGESTFQLFDAHVNRPAPSIAAARPDLPIAVCEAIDRALAKDPADRFPDADAMRRALTSAVGPPRARRWPIVAIGAAAMAIGAVCVVALWPGSHASIDAAPALPLPAQYQRGLDVVADNLAHNLYTKTDILRMVCPIDRLFRDNSAIPDDTYRRYLHRLHAMLRDHAGPDLATACVPYIR